MRLWARALPDTPAGVTARRAWETAEAAEVAARSVGWAAGRAGAGSG